MHAAGVPTPSIVSSRSPPSHTLHTMTSVIHAILIQLFWFPNEWTLYIDKLLFIAALFLILLQDAH